MKGRDNNNRICVVTPFLRLGVWDATPGVTQKNKKVKYNTTTLTQLYPKETFIPQTFLLKKKQLPGAPSILNRTHVTLITLPFILKLLTLTKEHLCLAAQDYFTAGGVWRT